jgi:hypothetical protein
MTEPEVLVVPPARISGGGRSLLAIGLIVLAAVFAVLYRVENSSENHSYNSGATPPLTVHITLGRQYEISTPGGPKALSARVGAGSLNCNYTAVNGTSTDALDTTRLDDGTRTTHAVATFIAPVTGSVRIECRALQSTFIDDADNVGGDPAGLFLLLCTICLTVGAMLGLSVLYRRSQARTADLRVSHAAERPDDGEFGNLLASPSDG